MEVVGTVYRFEFGILSRLEVIVLGFYVARFFGVIAG